MRIWDLAVATPWAITTEALEVILSIAARDEVPAWAVEAMAGRKLDNTRSVTHRNGVAIIPITGSIVRHGDMFSEVSGAVSVNALAQDFTTVLNDRSVEAILFNIDSPGGEINGVSELSNMIHAARGTKPIQAYISHLGCSAAYWIASACDRITCDATASVGSIGVVAAVPNPERDRKYTVEFVSSQSPRKRADITTDRGKQQVQSRLDDLADVFIASVARNRGVSTQTVIDDFGQGGVFVGAKAVAAGLVDAVSSFEATLAALVVTAREQAASGVMAAHSTGEEHMAGEREDASRVARFIGWLGGGADNPFAAIPVPAGQEEEVHMPEESTHSARAAQADVRSNEIEARLAASEQRNAALEAELFRTRAESIIGKAVLASQVLPAVEGDWVELYVAAMQADATAGQPRVTPLLNKVLASQHPHTLATGERFASTDWRVLTNQTETPGVDGASDAELSDIEKKARAYASKGGKRA